MCVLRRTEILGRPEQVWDEGRGHRGPGMERNQRASRWLAVEDVLGWQHAAMHYSRDEDAVCVSPEEDDVPALLHTAQAGPSCKAM
jgi:hypothetical protein